MRINLRNIGDIVFCAFRADAMAEVDVRVITIGFNFYLSRYFAGAFNGTSLHYLYAVKWLLSDQEEDLNLSGRGVL